MVHQTQYNEVESKKFAFSCTVLECSSIANSHFVDAALQELDAAHLRKNRSRLLDFSLSTVL